MKKMTCLALALLLCLSGVALAESTPSRMIDDMASIEVTAEHLPANSGFFIHVAKTDDPSYQGKVTACLTEIEKLKASPSVENYFGELKDSQGNVLSPKDILGTDAPNVFEFAPVIAGNYEEAYGKVTATMLFSTPYAKDEPVIVMIGLVTINADGTQSVKWTAYQGVGLGPVDGAAENMGSIKVELDAATVEAIQNGTALLAVISK